MVLISLTCVSAVDINQTSDSAVQESNHAGEELLADDNAGNFTDLNSEITAETTQTLELTKNYTYDSDADSSYEEGINITDDFTVDGNGYTINGNSHARIFNIINATVTLKNINFINGYGDFGGAIYSENSNLTIINCNFTSNIAVSTGEDNSNGGAIYFDGDALTIDSSKFISNKAHYGGAIIIESKTSEITNTEFSENSAVDSGALGVYSGNILIDNCTFDSNYANESTGALSLYCGDATLNKTVFKRNRDNETGVLFYSGDYNCSLIVDYCEFISNDCCAAYLYSFNAKISNSKFKNSVSEDGIAIYNSAINKLYLSNNTVNSDEAQIFSAYGGDITSGVTVRILNNRTAYYHLNETIEVYLSFYDDNDNLIQFQDFDLLVNNTKINYTFNSWFQDYEGNFTSNELGSYPVTIADTTLSNLTIQTAEINIVNVTDDFSTLQELIDNANGTLTLTKNYTYNPLTDYYVFSGLISKNITIDGAGFTIDAGGKKGIFYILSDNVTIKNITFINGVSYAGAAIIWDADYGLLTDCTFINNNADNGGAVAFEECEGNVIANCIFINNTAKTGGAIDAFCSIYCNIENCKFIGNNATYGGAINWDCEDTDFDDGDNIAISDCVFTDNHASEMGGAIHLYYCYNCNISDSNFTNNSAPDYAGAIELDTSNNAIISNCNFEDNSAEIGGAIDMTVSYNCQILYSNFTDNSAEDTGAAIQWWGKDGVISGCIFVNNSADNGGALYVEGSKNCQMSDCIFTMNSANNDGGAIYLKGSKMDVSDCLFENNYAKQDGGAIYSDGFYSLNISDCSFTGNFANNDGGAVYFENNNLSVVSSKFINNTAAIDGGAIDFQGNEFILSGSEFINNTSLDDSGAINVYANKSVISKSVFENNAAREISAVYICGQSLIESSKFISNTASESISAILNGDGNLTVNNCYFEDNYDEFGITIRNSMYSNLTVSNSVFESDDLKGKTVDNNYGTLYLYNNTINTQSSEIHNYGGKILSPCTATVVTSAPFAYGVKTKLYAFITDDNGNLIEEGYYVYFNVNGTLVEAEFNSNISGYEAECVFYALDSVEIFTVCSNINITDNNGINTTVVKANSTVIAPDIIFDYGSFGSTTLTLNGTVGFNATVVNSSDAFVVINGNTIFVSNLDAGNYSLNVTTTPDDYHNSVSYIAKITVNKANASLIIPTTEFEYGSDIIIAPVLDGISSIDLAFVPYHNEAVINISADNVINISGLYIGDYILVVSAIPDNNHNEMSAVVQNISVVKSNTQLTASSVTATYKVAKKLVITLEGSNGVLANKSVTVKVGTISKTLTTNSKGQVSVDVSALVPKAYTATVKFAGDDNYTASSKSVKVTVKKAAPKLTAKKKNFKAKVKTKKYSIILKTNKNKAMKKVKVTLKVNGKTYKAKTNKKGKATFKITKLAKKGTFKAKITYKGNSYYSKVAKTVKIKVK